MDHNTNLPDDLKKAVNFHGHLCPGLLIGWRAARIGLERLQAGRSKDEELVAIVENSSCSVDAVQSLTGATFGKGNFFFKDHGKQVFTFGLRPSGKAVRVALRADAFKEGTSRDERAKRLLEGGDEELFKVREVKLQLPPEAEIHKSLICERCGEQVMDTRTRKVDGKLLCIPCAEGQE